MAESRSRYRKGSLGSHADNLKEGIKCLRSVFWRSPEGNRITNSDEAAVWLEGDNNKVTGNWINEAPIGVWKFGGGGNVVAGNHFVNTPTPFLDPPPSDPGANPIPFR